MIKINYENAVNDAIYISLNRDRIYGVRFSINIMIKSKLYDVIFHAKMMRLNDVSEYR